MNIPPLDQEIVDVLKRHVREDKIEITVKNFKPVTPYRIETEKTERL